MRQLGEGGMGTVYLVEDLLLRQRCALKTLSLSSASDAEELERFRREVSLTHTIHHPNVARTYDIGEENGIHYLSMEWLEGESLMAKVKRGELLSSAETRRLLIPLCDGLQAAHDAGVVHRDLKPANIMLVNDGRGCVVVDFGIAAQMTGPSVLSMDGGGVELNHGMPGPGLWEVTSAGRGTPAYMAPEQWDGRTGDARTDVYALGVILYVALTGKAPYQAMTVDELADHHRSSEPPDVRELKPTVDRGLAELIQACLAKDPADRPQTMRQVKAMLSARSRRLSWLKRMLLSVAVVTVATTALNVGAFELAKHSVIQEMRPALFRLAQLVASTLTEDERRMMMADKIDAKSERFAGVVKKLNAVRVGEPEIKSVYVMRRTQRLGFFTVVADALPESTDEDGDGVISDDEKGVEIGSIYDGREYPEMTACLDKGAPRADTKFAQDAWGIALSGYAPVLVQSQKRPQLFLGVDATNTQLTRLRRQLDLLLLSFASIFLLLYGVASWPRRLGGTVLNWRDSD